MSYLIFALFIGVPILEISIFISVGEEIGLSWTLVIIILTAVIGTWIMKRQGFKTLVRLREQLNNGRLPLSDIFNGFCLLLAGALLLTPGFVTDGLGFLLFMPPFQNLLRASIGQMLAARGTCYWPGTDKPDNVRETFGKSKDGNVGSRVIDGEYTDLTGQDKAQVPKTGPDAVVRRIDK